MTNAPNEDELYNSWPPYMDCPKPKEKSELTENKIDLSVYQNGKSIYYNKVKTYKLTNDNGYMSLKIIKYNDCINKDEEINFHGNFVVKVYKIG